MSDRRTPRTCFSHLAHPGATWRWAWITGWTFWSSPCTSCSWCWSDFGYVLYNIQWLVVTVLCLHLHVISNTSVNACRHSYNFLYCWPLIKSAYWKTSWTNPASLFFYSMLFLCFLYILSTVYVQKGEKYNQRLLSSGPLYDMVSCKFLDKSCISYCSNSVLFRSTSLLVYKTNWPLFL